MKQIDRTLLWAHEVARYTTDGLGHASWPMKLCPKAAADVAPLGRTARPVVSAHKRLVLI